MVIGHVFHGIDHALWPTTLTTPTMLTRYLLTHCVNVRKVICTQVEQRNSQSAFSLMQSWLPHFYIEVLEDHGNAEPRKSWLVNTITQEAVELGPEAR